MTNEKLKFKVIDFLIIKLNIKDKHKGYNNVNNIDLNAYGIGPFCKFVIEKNDITTFDQANRVHNCAAILFKYSKSGEKEEITKGNL